MLVVAAVDILGGGAMKLSDEIKEWLVKVERLESEVERLEAEVEQLEAMFAMRLYSGGEGDRELGRLVRRMPRDVRLIHAISVDEHWQVDKLNLFNNSTPEVIGLATTPEAALRLALGEEFYE